MALLTQNSKMKKSGGNNVAVYNFTLPAFQSKAGFKTCPMAGACAAGCYARMGTYRFSNVTRKHEANLQASLRDNFGAAIWQELVEIKARTRKSGKQIYVRIHDSGDFYSRAYLKKWLAIAAQFPSIEFYAYSKMITMVSREILPPNFKVIFSLGGREDSLIDQENNRHSKVFETEIELLAAGYINTSDDDLKALGPNKKIGLVYHGNKSFNNTAWDRVTTTKMKKVG